MPDPAQSVNEALLAYLEERYQEHFQYLSPCGSSLDGSRRLLASCQSLPGKEVLAELADFRSQDRHFLDNYLALKYEEETLDFLQRCAREVFGEAKTYYSVTQRGLPPELSPRASFQEYLADTSVPLAMRFALKNSSLHQREEMTRFAQLLSREGTRYSAAVYVVWDEDFQQVRRDTLPVRLRRRDFVYHVKLSNTAEGLVIQWTQGGN